VRWRQGDRVKFRPEDGERKSIDWSAKSWEIFKTVLTASSGS